MSNPNTVNFKGTNKHTNNSFVQASSTIIKYVNNIIDNLKCNFLYIPEKELLLNKKYYEDVHVAEDAVEENDLFIKNNVPIFFGLMFESTCLIQMKFDELCSILMENSECLYSDIYERIIKIEDKELRTINDDEKLAYTDYVRKLTSNLNKEIDTQKIIIVDCLSKLIAYIDNRNEIFQKEDKLNICSALNQTKSHLNNILTMLLKCIKEEQLNIEQFNEVTINGTTYK